MMKITGHCAVALMLILSTVLSHAQTLLSTQGASAQSNSNAGLQISTQSIRSAPQKTAPPKTAPKSQFNFDVLVGVNGSGYFAPQVPKPAGVLPGHPSGNPGLRGPDFVTPPTAPKPAEIPLAINPTTGPSNSSILQNSQTPASPLQSFSVNRDDRAGLEIGIGITSKNGPNEMVLKPYYKRTPMNNADSLRELYGSKNTSQEIGVQLRSTF